jgi:ribose transport system substrate-binding protein
MSDQLFSGLSMSSRRQLLRMMGLGAAAPFAASILAACGDDDGSALTASTTTAGSAAGGPLDVRRTMLNSFYTLNNIYFFNYDQGAREAAEVLNIDLHRVIDEFDISVQTAAFENAPSLGVEGITMIANSEASQPEQLALVDRLGIPAVNNHSSAAWSTPLDIGENYVAYNVDNNEAAILATASAAFEALGGEGNVLYIEGIRGNSINTERTRGLDMALAQFPGINELAREPGDWSRISTQPVIDDLLTAYPDVDCVICSNDESAIATVTALEERGIEALVTGVDGIQAALDLIEQGRMFSTFAFHPGWLGAYSTVLIWDFLNGWRPSVEERMMYFGGFIVDTPESAAEYGRLFYESGRLPYDYEKMSKVLHPDDWDPGNLLVPIEPAEHWAEREADKPDGYELPEEYASAKFADVAQSYADHFGPDPLQSVRDLTRSGGEIII